MRYRRTPAIQQFSNVLTGHGVVAPVVAFS
jgi:hypothetical protein